MVAGEHSQDLLRFSQIKLQHGEARWAQSPTPRKGAISN